MDDPLSSTTTLLSGLPLLTSWADTNFLPRVPNPEEIIISGGEVEPKEGHETNITNQGNRQIYKYYKFIAKN